jgi:hypothetical protein
MLRVYRHPLSFREYVEQQQKIMNQMVILLGVGYRPVGEPALLLLISGSRQRRGAYQLPQAGP